MTNHDEAWTPREVLEHLTKGHHALVLRLLRNTPVSKKIQLAERHEDLCSTVAARTIKTHRKCGLVREHLDRDQYECTAFGILVSDAFQTLRNTLGEEGVTLIARSPSIMPILQHITENPESPATLADAHDIPGGRSVIDRRAADLEDIGWLIRSPAYEPSPTGRVVVVGYESFVDAVGRALDHREFLRTYDSIDTDKHPGAVFHGNAGSAQEIEKLVAEL